jgi:HEAT repeat protein
MRSNHLLAVCVLLSIAGIVGCGQDEVTRLISELHSAEPPARERAATALGRQPLEDQRVAPALEAALEDTDPAVRLAAATSLLSIAPETEAPRAVLLEAIRDGHAATLSVLGNARAEWAIDALVEQLDSRHPHVRALSAQALGEIGVGNEAVLTALRRRSLDPVEPVRDAAAAAIDAISTGGGQPGA